MPGDIPRLLEVPLFEGTSLFIPRDEESIQVEIIMTKHMFVNLPAVLGNAMRSCHETAGRIASRCLILVLRSWRYGYRSHLLLNKWWGWWSKLIHAGCEAGLACNGRTLKMVPANALHRALLALLSGRLVYVDLASFIGLLIGPDWMG